MQQQKLLAQQKLKRKKNTRLLRLTTVVLEQPVNLQEKLPLRSLQVPKKALKKKGKIFNRTNKKHLPVKNQSNVAKLTLIDVKRKIKPNEHRTMLSFRKK